MMSAPTTPEPVAFPPIERDEEMDRTYIPVHQNWEIQTQGTGSSFRIAKRDDSGERWLVLDKHLHDMLTEMAEDIHKSQSDAAAIIAAKDVEIERLNREASACDMLEEYRQDAQTTADALGHIQQQFEMVNNDRDDWIACHAKIFREMQETKTLLGNKCAEVERLTRERDTARNSDEHNFNRWQRDAEQLAEAQRESKSVAMALCRWKCGSISGDELAAELFAVFASDPSIEATQGKEGD